MFGSQILDVAIGMIFVYLLLSLVCSAANELIESRLKNRAKSLETGIRNLLGNALSDKLYNHDLISGLFSAKKGKPSYIPSRTFALALLNIVAPQGVTPTAGQGAGGGPGGGPGGAAVNPLASLRATISALPDNAEAASIKQALTTLIDDAQGDVDKLKKNVEDWYDGAMDRVSGWYKRRVHMIIMFLGLIVAVTLNADSISILKVLANDKAVRDSVVAAADAYAKANASPNPTPSAKPTPTATPAPKPPPSGNPPPGARPGPAATPTATPPPSGSPAPAASPTPECWKKEKECKDDENSAACKLKKSQCACWAEECTEPDSAKCKLKKSQCALEGLGLPLGWNSPTDQWPGVRFWQPDFWTDWWTQIQLHWLGWLLTALAISLGAPFWFDMLNKFIVVRSTVKPKEKSQDEPSKS